MMLQSDKFWPDFAHHVGLAHLVDDDRFRDAGARFNGAGFWDLPIPVTKEYWEEKKRKLTERLGKAIIQQ